MDKLAEHVTARLHPVEGVMERPSLGRSSVY